MRRADALAGAKQAAYQGALAEGLEHERATHVGASAGAWLRERWLPEHWDRDAELDRLEALGSDGAHELVKRLAAELAQIRRERDELREALAYATGQTLTTVGRLYGPEAAA